MTYPLWKYYPLNAAPPDWARELVDVVNQAELTISTVDDYTGHGSDAVLALLRPGLERLGYEVEKGRRDSQKVKRTVLYGEIGCPEVNYNIDAFNDYLGIAVEVEAGRGASNNADYRDIVRTSLVMDARNLALVMPQKYRYVKSGAPATTLAYAVSRARLDAIYASQRLKLPFDGVLLLGY